jgi:hypothetical protein
MIIHPFGKISRDKYVSHTYNSEPIQIEFPVDATTVVSLHSEDKTELERYGAAFDKLMATDISNKVDLEKLIFEFYTRIKKYDTGDYQIIAINSPEEIWSHISVNSIVIRTDGSSVYIQVELDCDWDIEHGMQIVYRDGDALVRVGENDGNCVASEFYRDEGVVDRV